ncbi:MAG: transporter substrate-binding domain-containing protein [Phycisphaerales bacterium]
MPISTHIADPRRARLALAAGAIGLFLNIPAHARATPSGSTSAPNSTSLTPTAPTATTLPSPVAGRTITFGVDSQYQPVEWTTPDGEPRGFQIDLIRAIADAAGFELRFVSSDWSQVREGFMAGRIDCVGMAVEPSRRDYADFSVPHSIAASELYVRTGTTTIDSVDDLAGKEVIVESGAASDEWLSARHPGVTIVRVPDETDAVTLLASGKHDAAILTQIGGRAAIRSRAVSNVTTVGPFVFALDYCFAVREGDEALLGAINQGLGMLKATGGYNRIYDRWFGATDRDTMPLRDVLKWATIVLVPLTIGALAVVLWTRTLRRRVRDRTRELEREIARREQWERRQTFMLRELDHRCKNTLSTVLSLADLTASATSNVPAFHADLARRVHALARSHEALAVNKWDGVHVLDLVRRLSGPYAGPETPRIDADGDNPMLPPEASQPLSLVLNELVSNSSKHGALARPAGVVEVSCAASGVEGFTLTWREPYLVPAGQSTGHGSRFLEDSGAPASAAPATIAPPNTAAAVAAAPITPRLGLSLVKALVEYEMGGTLSVRAEQGQFQAVITVHAPKRSEHPAGA